jgi:L-aspartate oxidase
MWNFVGIVRNDFRLQKALNRLRMIASDVHELYWSTRPTATLLELRNICLVALSICEAAERRKESRGLHYNQDHLATDAAFVGELHGRLDPVGALHWSWTGGPFSS